MKCIRPMIILIATLGVSGQAAAVRQVRISEQSAVNNCQVALPSFEGAFRKRPLGTMNVSASTAFISCGLSLESLSGASVSDVFVWFTNRGTASENVSCVLVEGAPVIFAQTTFIPKSLTIPSGLFRRLDWSQFDNGDLETPFSFPNISCAIPPGVEINLTEAIYDIEIGR